MLTVSGESWSRSQVVWKYNIIKSPQQLHHNANVFRNNNNNNSIPLLCYIVKHFFYIPPILVVWRLTTSQSGAFDTAHCVVQFYSLYINQKEFADIHFLAGMNIEECHFILIDRTIKIRRD
jgi:hypothetical protein